MIKGILLHNSGNRKSIAEVKNYEGMVHEAIKEDIGGFMELVYPNLKKFPKNFVFFCNEEGKLLNLPINYIATKIQCNPNDIIVGNVVIFKEGKDENGEIDVVDMTKEDQDMILKFLHDLWILR